MIVTQSHTRRFISVEGLRTAKDQRDTDLPLRARRTLPSTQPAFSRPRPRLSPLHPEVFHITSMWPLGAQRHHLCLGTSSRVPFQAAPGGFEPGRHPGVAGPLGIPVLRSCPVSRKNGNLNKDGQGDTPGCGGDEQTGQQVDVGQPLVLQGTRDSTTRTFTLTAR